MSAAGSTSQASRFRCLSPDRRRLLLIGGALVVLAGVGTAVVVARGGSTEQGARATDDMSGMNGMAGMDMGGDGSIRLAADQLRQFGVTFGSVEQRTLTADVRTTGVVTFDETRVAQVVPRFSGYVERLYVDYTGQPVRRGQPLAAIYSPELVAAQEELLLARRLEETLGESAVPGVPTGTSDLVGAARRRLRLWGISEAQIDDVLRTGRAQRTLTLHAPTSGVVVEKNVVQGQAIQTGQTLYTITPLDVVWVEAELREGQAALVREGTGADIEVAGYPGRSFKGRVEFVHPTLDTMTRTLTARVAVANADRLLKPGMFATVRLTTPTREALTAPTSAVVRTGERALVFVDMGDGRLLPQEVEVGRATGEYTEILAGLEPGQRVVTSAQFLLDAESNLADVMRAMMGQMNMSDMEGAGGMEGMDGMDMKGADVKGMPGMSPSQPRR